MISDFGTHISPSKTYFAMPISLYLKRPLLSLSVVTFTIYSIDICSFTELKKKSKYLRVLSGKITIVYIFLYLSTFSMYQDSRGCHNLFWISPKIKINWIFFVDLLSYFHLLLIYIEIFLRSKQFIIRNWEEKTCYCFVAKADNKTELSKNNKNMTFPVFSPSF